MVIILMNILFCYRSQYNLDFNTLANRASSGQFQDGKDNSGAGGAENNGKMNSGSSSDASM